MGSVADKEPPKLGSNNPCAESTPSHALQFMCCRLRPGHCGAHSQKWAGFPTRPSTPILDE